MNKVYYRDLEKHLFDLNTYISNKFGFNKMVRFIQPQYEHGDKIIDIKVVLPMLSTYEDGNMFACPMDIDNIIQLLTELKDIQQQEIKMYVGKEIDYGY